MISGLDGGRVGEKWEERMVKVGRIGLADWFVGN
jgi:hypothetical protein